MSKNINEYGSEFDWDSNKEFIKIKLNNFNSDRVLLLRSGRDALALIANKYKNSYKNVIFPALCCESMVTPFIRNNYKIQYYKLNKDLSGDIEDIAKKMQEDTIFVYMNYFGIKSLEEEFIKSMKDKFNNIVIIEDKTQDILVDLDRLKRIKVQDYLVCSLRKWMALHDGGLLYTNQSMGKEFEAIENNIFSDLRLEAMKEKSNYIKSGDEKIKECFRNKLTKSNEYLNNDFNIVKISKSSINIIQNIDLEQIKLVRKNNVNYLINKLKEVKGITSIYKSSDLGNLYYPILVKNRDEIQFKLAQKNIYCPVIWPLPKGSVGICNVSNYISEHMLAIPCDQRYTEDDMNYICSTLKLIMEEK